MSTQIVEEFVIATLRGLVNLAPDVMELFTGNTTEETLERLDRAEQALADVPADVEPSRAARRARIERILAGEG